MRPNNSEGLQLVLQNLLGSLHLISPNFSLVFGPSPLFQSMKPYRYWESGCQTQGSTSSLDQGI